MAKESKTNAWLLFTVATVLLLLASWLRSFPVFIFAALAPLFAITDHANENNFWNKLELIGVALAIGIFSWFSFDMGMLVPAICLAIAFTLAFGAYSFSRNSLGGRFGKLPLILFWLTTEYLLLKLFAAKQLFFLADAVYERTEWLRWTSHTGYLGTSFWILTANLFFYHGLFQNGFRWPWLVVWFVVIVSPIAYSYMGHSDYLARLDMQLLYMDGKGPESYRASGEWMARSAAWVAVLVLLSAFVKSNIKKK